MAVLLALSILAFALNNLKRGAITQLAKNVDQNRLTILAESANNEVLAMLKSHVNMRYNSKSSNIYNLFRRPFTYTGTISPNSPFRQVIISGFEPPETKKMAIANGYKLHIKTKVVLTVYKPSPYKSVKAFCGFIDLYAQAYRIGFESNLIELHERREVRLVDLRHRFDKYALFVKNYCPDYNNTSRRIMVIGIKPRGADISKVYLGNANYTKCADPQKNIWLDISRSESKRMDLAGLFGNPTIQSKVFPVKPPNTNNGQNILFYFKKVLFSNISGVTFDQFTKVLTVKRIYEKFVNEAADGCLGHITPPKISTALISKCSNSMGHANANAASYKVCKDFVQNAKARDYSKCKVFVSILATCVKNWYYHFGYTDAESIWNVDQTTRPSLPTPKSWVNALAYCGIASTSKEFRYKGSYFAKKKKKKNSLQYNPERAHIGKMARFFGINNSRKVLFEGPVFLRFFKIAYLDDFSTTIDFGLGKKVLNPEPIPLPFLRYDKPKTFLNTPLSNNFSPLSTTYKENYLMSRAVDNIPANCLLGKSISFYNGNGNATTFNPYIQRYPSYPYPMQKKVSGRPYVRAKRFGRLIDFDSVSYNYPNPQKFLSERVAKYNGKKTLFVDGVMYIEKGDLDLSNIHQFYGNGMIYLGEGNCYIGNFSSCRDPFAYGDTVRFYLRKGDFIVKDKSPNVTIEASLAALYYPPGSPYQTKQGSLICTGKKTVNIIGNLIVDYLYTQGTGGSGLIKGGKLIITHNPLIYDPNNNANKGQGAYHISISPVKTMYSLNAGGKTF